IVMAPKSLLRHPMAVSTPEELMQGTVREFIPASADPAKAERLVLCSGKVYYDLIHAIEGHEGLGEKIAVARLEQLYPFPEEDVKAELERYKGVKEVVWLQEEPANMGAWM